MYQLAIPVTEWGMGDTASARESGGRRGRAYHPRGMTLLSDICNIEYNRTTVHHTLTICWNHNNFSSKNSEINYYITILQENIKRSLIGAHRNRKNIFYFVNCRY